MEKTHATVDGSGLQISLKELQQYGVEPGARVTLEFGQNRILVTLPITDPHQVEDLALRLTVRYLGDATRVKAAPDDSPFNRDGWKVGVYRTDLEAPVGYLFFRKPANSCRNFLRALTSCVAKESPTPCVFLYRTSNKKLRTPVYRPAPGWCWHI